MTHISKAVGKYLKTLEPMQKSTGIQTLKQNGNCLLTFGKAGGKQNQVGSQRGEIGCLALRKTDGTLKEITAVIETGNQGAAVLPLLTSQQNSSMNSVTAYHEGATSTYANPDDYRLPKIPKQDIEHWGKTYIQGMAALEPITMKTAIVEITKLRARKPMQNMENSAVKLFIAMAADYLVRAGYPYFAVEEGIFNLSMNEESAFFPSDNMLRKYIYPVHYKFKQKMSLLSKMLENSQQVLTIGKAG